MRNNLRGPVKLKETGLLSNVESDNRLEFATGFELNHPILQFRNSVFEKDDSAPTGTRFPESAVFSTAC